jgi:serine/threonine-protein kinase RsbW
MPTTDELRLTVPATPDLLRLARVTAAGLGGRIGFTFDQVEDLRLAIDELCFGLTGPHGRPGDRVEIRYRVGSRSLEVEGTALCSGDRRPAELSELSKVILAALVDEHELSETETGPRFWVRKSLDPPPGHSSAQR